MGFGLESDAIHSPNENFSLDIFRKGIEAVIEFLSGICQTIKRTDKKSNYKRYIKKSDGQAYNQTLVHRSFYIFTNT